MIVRFLFVSTYLLVFNIVARAPQILTLTPGSLVHSSCLTNKNLAAEPIACVSDSEKEVDVPSLKKARFIVAPEIFIHHTAERSFIGQGAILLENGDILMAFPSGRPPTDIKQSATNFPLPTLYRSKDNGRTWKEEGSINMSWKLASNVSDGGVSFLHLKDGRLVFLAHRNVKELFGGGLPVISFSDNEGKTWSPAQLVGNPEGVWYVMNDRLIQLDNGRILVPVAHMPKELGTYEGDHNLGLCFFSDDGGKTWKRSNKPADLNDGRGMAEPSIAYIGDSSLIMLARTGTGYLYRSYSDDGGYNWSTPEPTTLVAACSPLTLKRLPDGRLIVFYDHAQPLKKGAFFPRTPLVYAISSDKGKSWTEPVVVDDDGIENNGRQNIYPSVCFVKEGILVVWATIVADPGGNFGNGGQNGWKIGGAKRAILAYPKN